MGNKKENLMRIALLATLATMFVACATEVGNPGPVSKPNTVVTDKPDVTTTTDPVYKGTLPAEIEIGVFVAKLKTETVPKVTIKRFEFQDAVTGLGNGVYGILANNVETGEDAWSAPDKDVDYNPATGELRAKTGTTKFRLYQQQK